MIKDNLYIGIDSDGEGGIVTAWRDLRIDVLVGNIFAQRVDSTGWRRWGDSAEPVCTAYGTQIGAMVASDGTGGAFIGWTDYRSSEDFDIYVNRVEYEDQPPEESYEPEIVSIIDVPGDQGGQLSVIWDRSGIDDNINLGIDHYTIWRRLSFEATDMLFASPDSLRAPAPGPSSDPGKRPILKLDQAGFAWEWITDMPARFFETYVATVPSLHDSTALGTGWPYFMVSAVTHDPYLFYDSEVDSGYSIDNLSPCAPVGMLAEQSYAPAGLSLSWTEVAEEDLGCYHVYRGLSGDFVPEPGNLVASPPDAVYFDGEWTWDSGYWYKVAAIDIHGNESDFAVTGPGSITGGEPAPVPDATFLDQNFPNPFNPNTTISFGLKESGHVSLMIFDAAGRFVATLVDESRPAGRYTVEWNGCDGGSSAMASGVYFYRMKTGEETVTLKMILLR